MTRKKLMLSVMAAGLLAGCASPAAPYASPVVSQTAPISLQQEVIPGNAGPTDGSATPNGATADVTAMSQFKSTPVAGLPACTRYSVTATVNGKPQPLNGEACRQPDGSWHIAEQAAGSTVVYQTVYWPAPGDVAYNACLGQPYPYYPYATSCLYDFPFGFSIGFPFFIDDHHNFHRFGLGGGFHHFGQHGHFGPAGHFDGTRGFHGGFDGGFHGVGFAGGGFHHG